MRQQLLHIHYPQLKLSIVTACTLFCVAGCSVLPLINQGSLGEPAEPVPQQQQVITQFENQIADQLIEGLPDRPAVITETQLKAYAEAVDAVLNKSGINSTLLTYDTQIKLRDLQQSLKSSRYELSHWSSRNHLADLDLLLVQHEKMAADELEKGEQMVLLQNQLSSLATNLSQQDPSIYQYPSLLAETSSKSYRLLTSQIFQPSTLNIRTTMDSIEDQRWLEQRLGSLIPETERAALLERFSEKLTHIRTSVDRASKVSALGDVDAWYSNEYFDVNREAEPEQVALDLMSVYLEEALLEMSYQSPVSLMGVETRLLALHRSAEKQSSISLSQLLSTPAFEYQSFSFEIAAAITSNHNWPLGLKQSMDLAMAKRLESDLLKKSVFSPESQLGSQVRLQTFYEFAIAELLIAKGELDVLDLPSHLSRNLPYNENQLNALILNWMVSNASYAAAALLLDEIKDISIPSLTRLQKEKVPDNMTDIRQSLNAIVAPEDS